MIIQNTPPLPPVLRGERVGARGAGAPREDDAFSAGSTPLTPSPSPPGVPGGEGTRRGIALAVVFLALAGVAPAQEPAKKKFEVTVPYDGVQLFARLLDDAGLVPIKTFDELGGVPADKTILIIFGDPKPLERLEARPGRAAGFLNDGGAIFIASERPFSFARVPSLGLGEARIHAGDLINFDFQKVYQGHRECPLLIPSESPRPADPILKGITEDIATNCPGFLSFGERRLQTLLNLPRDTAPKRVIIFRDLQHIEQELNMLRPYLAVAPDRRLAVMAGHGVFMNCLAIRKDIGNSQLAVNLIAWLKDKKRTHVCFLHEGEAVTDFTLPLAGPPRPPVPSIDAINKIIDVIQNEQLLQKVIDQTIGPEPIIRTMLYLATLGLLFYGAKKYFQSRWTLESVPSPLEGGAAQKPPLILQRQRELARKNELGEPARSLARDWFVRYAGLGVRAGQPLPKLTYQIQAGMLQRRKLSKKIDSLWALAGDPHPRGWTIQRLHGLTAILEELSLAVIAGEIEFARAA